MHCKDSQPIPNKISEAALDRYYRNRFEKLQFFLSLFDEAIDSGK